MISFKSIPHALATFFKAAAADLAKASPVVEKVIANKVEVEAVSDVVAGAAGGPAAVAVTNAVEDAAFAALGSIDAALKAGGAAAEQNLLNAGLDQAAIDAAKAVGASSVAVYTTVKAAQK